MRRMKFNDNNVDQDSMLEDFTGDKNKLEYISRENYEKVYKILADNVWNYLDGINITDIQSGAETGKTNNQLVNDLSSEEKIMNLINKVNANYDTKESEDFMVSVKASNVTDISDAGYFYKKLASCLDTVFYSRNDCHSDGEEFNVEDIDEDTFNFKVMNQFINETDEAYYRYDKFKEDTKGFTKIHVRNPKTCNDGDNRCFCKKCVGKMNTGKRNFNTDNIGLITTLAITEHATQSSLSSMNKGRKKNMNEVIESEIKYSKNTKDINVIKDSIEEIVNSLSNTGVQSRWYWIALLGRIFKQDDGSFVQSSLKCAANLTDDKMGSFLFSPNQKTLMNLCKSDRFKIISNKTKALFDIYE